MCVCDQSMRPTDVATRRRHYVLLAKRPADTCPPTDSREKKYDVISRYVKGTEEQFLFGVKKPIFSGSRGLRYLSEAS